MGVAGLQSTIGQNFMLLSPTKQYWSAALMDPNGTLQQISCPVTGCSHEMERHRHWDPDNGRILHHHSTFERK